MTPVFIFYFCDCKVFLKFFTNRL